MKLVLKLTLNGSWLRPSGLELCFDEPHPFYYLSEYQDKDVTG